MFESFQKNFPRDPGTQPVNSAAAKVPADAGLSGFLEVFGGASFRGSLYRTVHPADAGEWKRRISLAFPQLAGQSICFGYDWMGSIFAIDTNRIVGGQPGIIMFEPGTGEALEIQLNLNTFHNVGLMDTGDAILATSFYQTWTATGGAKPSYTQCIGYKKPLFLGGADDVENLEVSDLDVYWHLMGQLIAKTRGLPKGTRVHIKLEQ